MGARLKPLHRTKAAGGIFLGGVYDFDAFWGCGRCNFAVDGDDYDG